MIDGGCSPFRLIKSTDLSISIPFTSTALIGKHMNKPSCFYDPLNILDKDDRASQNLEVVKGKKIYKCGLASMYKIFITIKENSQRVKKKNFIRFKNNTPLFKVLIYKLNKFKIYIDTDSKKIMKSINNDKLIKNTTVYLREKKFIKMENDGKSPGPYMIENFLKNLFKIKMSQ